MGVIKFRVWDTQEKRWDKPTEEDIHVEEAGKICVPYYDNEGTFLYSVDDTNRHIVLQYTGLKDINGREIYEGDIVKIHGLRPNPFIVKFGKFEDRAEAGSKLIDSYGWHYYFDKLAFNMCNSEVGDTKKVEIIGNIYEEKYQPDKDVEYSLNSRMEQQTSR